MTHRPVRHKTTSLRTRRATLRGARSMSVPNGLSCTRYVQVEVGRFRPMASEVNVYAVGGDGGAPEGLGGPRRRLLEQGAERADRFLGELVQRDGPPGQGAQLDALAEVGEEGRSRSAQARSRWNRVIWRAASARTAQSIPWLSSARALRAPPGQRRQGLVAPQHLVAVVQDDAPLSLRRACCTARCCGGFPG